MTRETKEIVLPNGTDKIILNAYITGRDRRKMTSVFLKEEKDISPECIKQKGLKGTLYEEAQDMAFKIIVVSINGKKDGDDNGDGTKFSVVDFILDLPSKDFEFVVKEVNDVSNDKKFNEEKK